MQILVRMLIILILFTIQYYVEGQDNWQDNELKIVRAHPPGFMPDSNAFKVDPLAFYFYQNWYSQYFAFNNKDTTHIDSLLPLYKMWIDDVIKSNINKPIVDSNYLKKEWFRRIYNKIQHLKQKRSLTEENEIFRLISSLPNSPEKVWLYYECRGLKINNETYYTDIEAAYYAAKNIAEGISDKLEKVRALKIVGQFAASDNFNSGAIEAFYLAREQLQNLSGKRKLKLNEDAEICTRIAGVFSKYYLQEAYEESRNIQLEASHYYNEAQNYFNLHRSDIRSVHKDAFRLTWLDKSDSSLYKKIEILRNLRGWYDEFSRKEGNSMDSHLNYLALVTIGLIMEGEKLYSSATKYYLRSLIFAISDNSVSEILVNLAMISRAYALQKRKELALGYADMYLDVANKNPDKFDYYDAILNKGWVFWYLKQYDSAMHYADIVYFNASLKTIFYPSYYDKLFHQACNLKLQCFEHLKFPTVSDSLYLYERIYSQSNSNILNDFYYLKSVQIRTVLDINERVDNAKNELLIRKITLGAGIIFAVFLILFLIRYAISIRYKRLSESARSKIHNIENDISEIGFLYDTKKEQYSEYIRGFEAYTASYLKSWKNEKKVTLFDELEAFNRYYNFKKIAYPFLNRCINECSNLKTIAFIPSVFDTLLHNSIKAAYFDNRELLFTIDMEKKKSKLVVVITDNARPPNYNAKYWKEMDSGLHLLRKRIKLFHWSFRSAWRQRVFKVEALPNSSGTKVTIKVPLCKNIKSL